MCVDMAFSRDRLTWIAYGLLAWFAYLQAAPGLVVSHLRDEFGLSHTIGGLHVAAFAAGAVVAGLVSGPVERADRAARAVLGVGGRDGARRGRPLRGRAARWRRSARACSWASSGGLLLVTIQALLSDHHGERRAVALTEANVAASVAYVILIGALSLAAATGAGWRVALLASLLVPLAAWWLTRDVAISTPPAVSVAGGRLPAAFWVAATMLFCTTAVEWCIAAWGASFVEDAADVSADAAVSVMVGYFGGVVVGRVAGSALARRHSPHRLLAIALVVTAAGFAILWPSASPLQALLGLALLGVGIGNLFPLGLSVTVVAGAGPRAAGELAGGVHDVVRGAARAADGRHAGRRHLAERGARGRPGRARVRGDLPHARDPGSDAASREARLKVAAGAEEQLPDRVLVEPELARDLVAGELFEVGAEDHAALALGQLADRVAHAPAQLVALDVGERVVVGARPVDRLGDHAPLLERLVARRGRRVGAEVQRVGIELRQPVERRQQRVLRGVGRILRAAGDRQRPPLQRAEVRAVERRSSPRDSGQRRRGRARSRSWRQISRAPPRPSVGTAPRHHSRIFPRYGHPHPLRVRPPEPKGDCPLYLRAAPRNRSSGEKT